MLISYGDIVLIRQHTFHGILPEFKVLLSRGAGAALDDEIHVARWSSLRSPECDGLHEMRGS